MYNEQAAVLEQPSLHNLLRRVSKWSDWHEGWKGWRYATVSYCEPTAWGMQTQQQAQFRHWHLNVM
jgi:hypothetical protein